MSQTVDTQALPVGTSSVENPCTTDFTESQTCFPPNSGFEDGSWMTPQVTAYPSDSGVVSNSTYPSGQHPEQVARNSQNGGLDATPVTSSSTTATANVARDSNYSAYSSVNDAYAYGGAGYSSYYNSYHHQPNQLYSQQQTSHLYAQQQSNPSQVQQQSYNSDAQQHTSHSFATHQESAHSYLQQLPSYSYNQPVGTSQNSGAPYQPLSSLQNTASYVGATSYTTTYYNPGDYQTSGGYATNGYNNQNVAWKDGNYVNYDPQQYANYSSNSYSISAIQPNANSQHHYKQWADYYNQTEVTCAPGTEHLSSSSSSNQGSSISGVSCVPTAPISYPPTSHSQQWRPESYSLGFPVQPVTTSTAAHGGYWKPGTPSVPNYQSASSEPQYNKSLDNKTSYDSFQEQQNVALVPNSQYATAHQVSSIHQLPARSPLPFDSSRVSKLQVPTNPRIAPNLHLGASKTDKGGATTVSLPKPAYVSVSSQNSVEKSQPDAFPKSLRDYVVRAFSRCSDEAQITACQAVMKEIITKATADGTLCSRDWDAEPLFPLPDSDSINKPHSQGAITGPSFSLPKRGSNKRSKSRWEPISSVKASEKPNFSISDSINNGVWNRKPFFGSSGSKTEPVNAVNHLSPDLKNPINSIEKPNKRQRHTNGFSGVDNGDSSSGSDKEQSLTAYSAGAMALANNPEEKKRRESRSKRFEKHKVNGNEVIHLKSKKAAGGNLFIKRSNAVALSKTFVDGEGGSVEDIDWDSLTVKGTCHEIEKRYLRLTSAPDPSAVRPEEVLEKALVLVQNSDKNYLYKCDQLKSIRQDLTVQRIRNQLTVKVYETHARLALEAGDLPEYNQCQSQLKFLYAEGIDGCHMEFAAYNLLCVILHSNNRRDLLSAMSRLTAEAKDNEAVKHALAVRRAVTSGNYILFFRLHKSAPNLNSCLLDMYVEKMRYKAVNCMARSYRPTVPVSYISEMLGFANKHEENFEECVEWLKAHGGSLVTDASGEMLFDAKASSSSLCMPEPDDAVAHGDANLAVNDFLARASSQG